MRKLHNVKKVNLKVILCFVILLFCCFKCVMCHFLATMNVRCCITLWKWWKHNQIFFDWYFWSNYGRKAPYDFSEFYITGDRLDKFEFSTPIAFTPYAIFYIMIPNIPDNSIQTYATSLFKPFINTLWYFTLTASFTVLITWIIISYENATALLKLFLRNTFIFVKFLQGDFDENSLRFSVSKMFFFISLSLLQVSFLVCTKERCWSLTLNMKAPLRSRKFRS